MSREVLTVGQVRIHPGSVSKEDAMREAADILEAAGAVTSEYFDAMQQREQAVSTYMGNELAIPHGTNETKDRILASALSVVRYMVSDLGFPPERLAATGFGEFRPVASGNSPEARAQNRRIELKLTER